MTTVVPIVVSIVLLVRKTLDVKAYFTGFLAFFISQIVIRVPILTVLSTVSKGFSSIYSSLWGSILIGGLTAGLFEETARLIGGKLLLRKRETLALNDGISFGVGHALCEVIILVGLTYVSNLMVFIMINTDTFHELMLSTGVKEAQYTQYLETYTSTQAVDYAYGLLERCSAILFHVANTLLVFKAVNLKKYGYYALAILLHTAFNGLAIVLATYTNVPITEIVLLVFAIVVLKVQLGSRKSKDVTN
jgi:uncharacterized membrane protein YhfC